MLSGKEFKNKFKNFKFYKLLDINDYDNGYKYKEGLNEHYEDIKYNGFSFIDLYKIKLFINSKTKYIRSVEILDNSLVCIKKNEFLTNKFILGKKIFFKEFIHLINNEKENYLIHYINNKNIIKELLQDFRKDIQTKYLCELAIDEDPKKFKFIRGDLLNYSLCKKAIYKNPKNIKYIKDDNYISNLSEIAIRLNPLMLKYIRKDLQDYNSCYIAIDKNPLALQFVSNDIKDYDLCEFAVKKNPLALQFVDDKFQNYNLCKMAIDKNPLTLRFVKKELHDKILYNNIIFKYKKIIKFFREDLKKNEIKINYF